MRSFEKIDDVRMVSERVRGGNLGRPSHILLTYLSLSLQEYSFQITFRQQWNDNRLTYDDMNGEYAVAVVLDLNLLGSVIVIGPQYVTGHIG